MIVANHLTSAGPNELMTGLLDELRMLSDAANRPDLSDRLIQARGRVTDPTVRIVVTGQAGQGMSALVDALAGARVTRHGADQGLPVLVGNAVVPFERRSEHHPRIEVGTPSPLLAEGVVLVDAPGTYGADSAAAATVLELVAGADAVLFVSDASQEYTAPEIEFLTQLHRLCPAVIGVLTKIDLYNRWEDIQRANRSRLDAAQDGAGLDIPLLPVSALLSEASYQDGDELLAVESGVPQLVAYLRERVVADAERVVRDGVVNDVRTVSDHLAMAANAQLDAVRDPAGGGELVRRLHQAAADAERLRATSANWQLVLGDGTTEMMVSVEHDLRQRLRLLVREAEAEIMRCDPAPRWDTFDSWLRNKVAESVRANFVFAHVRATRLAGHVADCLALEGAAAVPSLSLGGTVAADQALGAVLPLEALESRRRGIGQRLINSLRGSYGGVLMVGVATSLAGLALVNPWSIGAGVLLGANSFWEDRKSRTTRRQSEAKVAVARLMDDVAFQVGDEIKYRLREVHRTMRDHFAGTVDELARTADQALAAAQQASYADATGRDARAAHLHDQLARLRDLRVRASALVR
ncbi:MAG TPA: EutP/PduV family microcompartment system protein [Pseudonocardia sp.]|nr:EutP/PduV family microcompartment system protein [Pseudonocardia sp.]